jgi:hypothetical protein
MGSLPPPSPRIIAVLYSIRSKGLATGPAPPLPNSNTKPSKEIHVYLSEAMEVGRGGDFHNIPFNILGFLANPNDLANLRVRQRIL